MAESGSTRPTRTVAGPSSTADPTPRAERPPAAPPPFLLDFYPLEDAKFTRLSPFFDALKEGRFTTTRCERDGLHWPPRAVCPTCHTEELVWVDLPTRGTIYAFSAVLAGAPIGMESDVPFAVGLVDLEGTSLRIFSRIVGRAWTELRVGQPVTVETYRIPDGRAFFRVRADAS